MIHPMHLHGMHMTVIAKDGWDQPMPWKCDTLNIAPGERWDVIVKATNPGTWAFHCHILAARGVGARHVRDGDGLHRGEGAADGIAPAAISSSAIAECAIAPPARISAATQIASITSDSVAPAFTAPAVCERMQ